MIKYDLSEQQLSLSLHTFYFTTQSKLQAKYIFKIVTISNIT